MLHRVEMNIVDMPSEIAFIAQRVLPIAPLPDAALALAAAACGNSLTSWQRMRKPRFDQSPARREIGVPLGQTPDRMQMIGQDDNCLDAERMIGLRFAKRRTQCADMFGEQARPSLREINGEEEAAAWNKIAPVLRHDCSIAKRHRDGFRLRLNPSYAIFAFSLRRFRRVIFGG